MNELASIISPLYTLLRQIRSSINCHIFDVHFHIFKAQDCTVWFGIDVCLRFFNEKCPLCTSFIQLEEVCRFSATSTTVFFTPTLLFSLSHFIFLTTNESRSPSECVILMIFPIPFLGNNDQISKLEGINIYYEALSFTYNH